jgi:hypothetical protein
MLQLMQFRVREKSGCSSPSSDRSHHVGEDDEDEEDCNDDEDGRFATLRSATIGPGAEGSGPSSPPAHLRDRPNIFQGSSARNVLEFRRLAIAVSELANAAVAWLCGLASCIVLFSFVNDTLKMGGGLWECAIRVHWKLNFFFSHRLILPFFDVAPISCTKILSFAILVGG